ncbi:MAG: hypothetical protein RL653_820 [Pseudomonadota bacterium]
MPAPRAWPSSSLGLRVKRPAPALAPVSLALLLGGGCEQLKGSHAPGGDAALLQEVRTRLAAREGKVTGYALTAEVREGPHVAKYEFWFRAPNKMRGDITEPGSFSYAFDGRFLYQQSDERRSLLVAELDPSRESTAVALLQTFSPFAPEGLRAPLLKSRDVTVQRVQHPKGPEAVKLEQRIRMDGLAYKLTYVLRWPSMDFLSKTLDSKGGSVELRVDEESCDVLPGLCFPRKLSEWREGRKASTTDIPDLDFSEVLPAEAFVLEPPQGFFVEKSFLDGGTSTARR